MVRVRVPRLRLVCGSHETTIERMNYLEQCPPFVAKFGAVNGTNGNLWFGSFESCCRKMLGNYWGRGKSHSVTVLHLFLSKFFQARRRTSTPAGSVSQTWQNS